MTRSSRIRSQAALALAITAVAVPAAQADFGRAHGSVPVSVDRVSPDARDAGRPVVIDHVTPDARDAGRPAAKVNLVSPDARDNGRREPAPIVVTQPALAQAEGFDWAAAGIGAGGLALLLVVGTGAATTVRTRRGPAHTA
jgi:hypothetical protein